VLFTVLDERVRLLEGLGLSYIVLTELSLVVTDLLERVVPTFEDLLLPEVYPEVDLELEVLFMPELDVALDLFGLVEEVDETASRVYPLPERLLRH
jgi:hypothetical protein